MTTLTTLLSLLLITAPSFLINKILSITFIKLLHINLVIQNQLLISEVLLIKLGKPELNKATMN